MVEDTERNENETEVRRRFHLLREGLDSGAIRIGPNIKAEVDSALESVTYLSSGEVRVDSIPPILLSLASVAAHREYREQLKESVSLAEIQQTYFSIIERHFGPFYEAMKESGLDPHDAAGVLVRDQSTVEELGSKAKDFVGFLKDFWLEVGRATYAHLEDSPGPLRGVFGGDLFPSAAENIASKCAIYLDTILVPDPFLRCWNLLDRWTKEQTAFYMAKHGLNLMKYKDLAVADVEIPILAVVPDRTEMFEDEAPFLTRISEADGLRHARRVFGREFESTNHLMEFAGELDTVEKLVDVVVDQRRVLFDTGWTGGLSEQVELALRGYGGLARTDNPGILVAMQSISRMMQSNDVLIKARRLSGTPLIDAPTSWQYFAWKLEYDASVVEDAESTRDLHVVRGLQDLAQEEMQWIGRIPPEAILEVRASGALEEIRTILGAGVHELVQANPSNFHRSRDEVFENLHQAFREHRSKIRELSDKKWRFAGKDLGSWLVVGSLEIAAASTGVPVIGLATWLAHQLGTIPTLKELPPTMREISEESRAIRSSPVGLLFKYANGK